MRRIVSNILFFVFGVFASIGVLTASAYSNSTTIFFESLYDVPVMPGLVEIHDYALAFDKPEGRVAEAAAIVDDNIQADDIMGFYSTSLPELGWAGKSGSVYVRDGEKLTISPETHEGKNVVLFLLEPR